jgi:toxin-antitoxin system PIN domain toxin
LKAVDTNILIYAEIVSSPYHERARATLTDLAESNEPWAIPWPCIYEFLRVVTHPRVYHPPMPSKAAIQDLKRLFESPSLILLNETDRHLDVLERLVMESGVSGNLIHDAHIAAICIEHGVSELLTADRDFSRFSGNRLENPLDEVE